ncbi:MAG: PASTA domain-containing protein [Nitriliruptoraceae bacterium]
MSDQQASGSPESEARPAKRPWWKKKRYVIPLGLLALIIAVPTGDDDGQDDVADAGDEPEESQDEANEEEAEEPEEEPEEGGEEGGEDEAEPADEDTRDEESSASDGVEVPDVAGLSVADAASELETVGLTASPMSDEGTVDATSPDIGEAAEEGEEVVLWVEPPPIELSGSGDTLTDPIELDSDVGLWEFTHDGDANFIVEALDGDGEVIDVFVNEIGSYDGSTVLGLMPSEVQLDVQADGAWTVEVRQPTFLAAEDLPLELEGDGDDVTPVFTGEGGAAEVAYSHEGDGNFILEVYDDFEAVDLLANEVGSTEGSTAGRFDADWAYVIDVTANGPWTVSIQP